jgi:hypothetical protein
MLIEIIECSHTDDTKYFHETQRIRGNSTFCFSLLEIVLRLIYQEFLGQEGISIISPKLHFNFLLNSLYTE